MNENAMLMVIKNIVTLKLTGRVIARIIPAAITANRKSRIGFFPSDLKWLFIIFAGLNAFSKSNIAVVVISFYQYSTINL